MFFCWPAFSWGQELGSSHEEPSIYCCMHSHISDPLLTSDPQQPRAQMLWYSNWLSVLLCMCSSTVHRISDASFPYNNTPLIGGTNFHLSSLGVDIWDLVFQDSQMVCWNPTRKSSWRASSARRITLICPIVNSIHIRGVSGCGVMVVGTFKLLPSGSVYLHWLASHCRLGLCSMAIS